MIPAPGSASSPARRPWPWWLGQAALFLLVAASIVRLPIVPELGLDTSWQMVLAYAADHGLQHGPDIIFTYGPLGYLMTGVYTGPGLALHVAWQVASALFVAAGLYAFGRRLTGWRQAGYYLFLLWFGMMYVDAMQMCIIAILGATLLEPTPRPGWRHAAVIAFFAILALIKFTHLMVCSVTVALLVAYHLAVRRPRDAGRVLGVFLGVFLAGWLLSGQSLLHLPVYLRYSLELSFGYSGAMGANEDGTTLALGLVAAAGAAGYLVLHFLTAADRRRAGTLCLMLGASLFMNWKHGFTRADGHVLAHYVSVLLLAATFPALTLDRGRWAGPKQALLGVAALACLAGIQGIPGARTTEAPAFWNDRLRDTVAALADLPRYQARLDAALADSARLVDRPGLRGFVGRATVDHIGNDQAVAVLNGFNYVPRPAIQSYAAYTPGLNRLDEAFYRSDRAPRFVTQRYGAIDDRLPALEDSLVQKLLYQDYDYVMEEGGVLLWERPEHLPPAATGEGRTLLARSVAFGERIIVPDAGDEPLWATVQVRQNLAGRLRQLLYKPPELHLQFEDDRGMVREARFVGAMGAAGFILQPYFPGPDELIAYQNGAPGRKIRWLSLSVQAGGEDYYDDTLTVELRTIRGFKRASNGLQPDTPWRFRMMNRPPARLKANAPALDTYMDGEHLLQMHPPSFMEWDIAAPVTTLRASFGFLSPGAWDQPGGTEGVDFIVEWVDAAGRVERLASRFLDPKRRPGDRPRQSLVVDLGGRHDGKLRLRTAAGPTGNTSFGWTYWTAIEIQ